MCDKTVFEDPFMLTFCLDRYRTQEMCDKSVDAFLQHKNLFLIGLLHKMIKKEGDAVFSNDGKIFFNEDYGDVNFSSV